MYDPQVFEGLLGGGSFSGTHDMRHMTGMMWRECDGVFYEVDAHRSGFAVFVSTLDWHSPIGGPDLF